jgi:hypothetical protein
MLSLAFCHIIPETSFLNDKTEYGALNGVFVMAGILISFATENQCCCDREACRTPPPLCPVEIVVVPSLGNDRLLPSEATGGVEAAPAGGGGHDATELSALPADADVPAAAARGKDAPGEMEAGADARARAEARESRRRLFEAEATEVAPHPHAHAQRARPQYQRNPLVSRRDDTVREGAA